MAGAFGSLFSSGAGAAGAAGGASGGMGALGGLFGSGAGASAATGAAEAATSAAGNGGLLSSLIGEGAKGMGSMTPFLAKGMANKDGSGASSFDLGSFAQRLPAAFRNAQATSAQQQQQQQSNAPMPALQPGIVQPRGGVSQQQIAQLLQARQIRLNMPGLMQGFRQ